ncbi:hypothetical protein [Microbacterium sp. USHLN186]|uniref:hypothetical protein n=1 Tax=Microbacterium sp. USHLN186 TaxID=3081286 RepID=UPI00301AB7C1
MSTDGSDERPLTRAELRALRAAEPAASAPAAHGTEADTPDVGRIAAERPTSGVSAPKADSSEPAPAPEADSPELGPPSAPDRRFTLALLSVLGVLAILAGVLGVVSLVQGPRLSAVQVDPAQAIESSGTRVILTANQTLDPIDAEQVSVQPAVPFTVDAAGRSIGVRFTVPLHDETTYTVSVAGVSAAGGGEPTALTTRFTTPASQIMLLQRDADGDDTIFLSDLSGEKAAPVFQHPRISDYRATGSRLVVAVEEDAGSRLIVMNRDGSDQRELKLPGEGYVSSVQVSDRAGLVGYSYSDRDLDETSGRASVLVTQPLSGAGEPRIATVGDAEVSVADWRFVPDSSSLLFIDFDGALSVEDPTTDAGAQPMGTAASILGVNRGTYTALVERADGSFIVLDLTDGTEQPLPPSDPDYGDAVGIEALPVGTLRHIVQRDEEGMPTGQAVVRVDEQGAAAVIAEVSGTDSILQTCASPSGQYVAVTTAPDLANNAYDDLLLPLPTTMHTELIDLVGDRTLPTLNGFDISWCRTAPLP